VNKQQTATIAAGIVGGGIVLYVLYQIWSQRGAHAQDTTVLDVGGMLVADNPWQSEGEHYVDPNQFTGPVTVMPHRYPPISGINLSVLARHGWAPLRKQMPQDFDYLNAPPSEGTL